MTIITNTEIDIFISQKKLKLKPNAPCIKRKPGLEHNSSRRITVQSGAATIAQRALCACDDCDATLRF